MGSLNSSSVNVQPKRNLTTRSLGRNITIASGEVAHFAQSSDLTIDGGLIESQWRGSTLIEVPPTGLVQSVYVFSKGVKVADSEDEFTIRRLTDTVALASGAHPEIGLLNTTTNHHAHIGARILNSDTASDTTTRVANTSFATGG